MDPSEGIPAGWSRETRIRRDARGRWFNGEDRIDHPQLVRAFERWLDRAEDGRYCLSNEINWAYVQVEGPPVFVRGVRAAAAGVLLELSGGQQEPLDPRTLRQDREGAVYCDVRAGRLAARFDRHALSQLVELAGDEDAEGPYLELGGRRWHPPLVHDPLEPMNRANMGRSDA